MPKEFQVGFDTYKDGNVTSEKYSYFYRISMLFLWQGEGLDILWKDRPGVQLIISWMPDMSWALKYRNINKVEVQISQDRDLVPWPGA